MMGIIEKGAEYAWIEAQAGYKNIGYAGVGSGFRLRGAETVYVPGLYGNYNATPYYAHNIIDVDYLSVGYYPLSGDQANYAGMAAGVCRISGILRRHGIKRRYAPAVPRIPRRGAVPGKLFRISV